MSTTYCISVCDTNLPMAGGPGAGDVAFDAGMQRVVQEAGFPCFDRLEFGSNFCPLEFLRSTWDMKMNLWTGFASRYSLPLTLVLPITNENLLPAVKRRVQQLLTQANAIIDEVVVNDFGMLEWVSNSFEVNLVVGRLFSKDLRDPRYSEAFPQVYRPALLTGALAALKERYPRIVAVEFDSAGWAVDLSGAPCGIVPALHTPYVYCTTGRICEAASAPLQHPGAPGGPRFAGAGARPPMPEGAGVRPETPAGAGGHPAMPAGAGAHPAMPAVPGSPEIEANPKRFRAETICKHQCVRAMTTYALHPTYPGTLEDDECRVLYYTKRGKTVYCLNDGVQLVGADGSTADYNCRLVHTPRHFGWSLAQAASPQDNRAPFGASGLQDRPPAGAWGEMR